MPSYDVRLSWPARVVLLESLTRADARDPFLRRLAREWRGNRGALDWARDVQRWFQQCVRFERDELSGLPEVFRGPWEVFRSRRGDCDCQARAVCALLTAGGVRCGLRYLLDGRQVPDHVVCVLVLGEKEIPLETTVAAGVGEHPDEAAERTMHGHAT